MVASLQTRRMPASGRSRSVLLAAAILATLGVAGCGSGGTPEAEIPGAAGSVAPSVSPSATVSPTSSATIPADLCSQISADDLSAALGVVVTVQTGPSGDCEFSEGSTRGLSGSVGVVADATTNGGFEGYLTGLDASMTNPTNHEIAGLGDAAVVKTGVPMMGSGENLMAAGAVDRGSFLLQITLVQGRGMGEAGLVTAAQKALRLIDSATA